jgi:hypothetical protein
MLDKLDEVSHVLVICTETYYRRFRGHEVPDKGKGGDWEGALITQELYDKRSKTCKFIPVLFQSNQEASIPEPLRSKTHYVLDSKENYDALYDLLSDQAGVEPGDVGPKKIKLKQKVEPLTFGTTANESVIEKPLPSKPQNKPDSEFITTIKQKMTFVLDAPDVSIFKDQMGREIESLPEQIKVSTNGYTAPDLAGKLYLLANQRGETNIAIETLLYNATMACLYKEGERYNESKPCHGAIKDAAEQLLSWLVLAALNDDSLSQQLRAITNTARLYFELPVKTIGGVELFLSRSFQRRTELTVLSDGANLSGRHALPYPPHLFSWNVDNDVQNMIRMIWNAVFTADQRDAKLPKEDIQKLNSELRVLKAKKYLSEHYYTVIKGLEGSSQEHFQLIYPRLLEELSELTLVRFGIAGEDLFVVPEDDLMNAIRNFLTDINKAIA